MNERLIKFIQSEIKKGNGCSRKKLKDETKKQKDLRVYVEQIDEIIDELASNEIITIGKGHGGPITILQMEALESDEEKISERQLYDKFCKLINIHKSNLSTTCLPNAGVKTKIFKTADNKSRKGTGGEWSLPDVVLVDKYDYKLLGVKETIIRSIEIKTLNNFSKKGLFEAVAHSKYVDYAFLAIHASEPFFSYMHNDKRPDGLEELKHLSVSHNIGLIIFTVGNDDKDNKFVVLNTPSRNSVQNLKKEIFLDRVLKSKDKKSF